LLVFVFTGLVFGVYSYCTKKDCHRKTVIFTIHKLAALALVIFIAIIIRNLLKNFEINNVILTLIIVTGLSVLTLFISGALLSLGKPVNNIISNIHRVTPIPTVITTAVIIYLLVSRK